MFESFNPSAAATKDAGIYGLPFNEDTAGIVIIPVNWELTVSYGAGTFAGPEAVKNASLQMDLHHHDFPNLWKKGIWMSFHAILKCCMQVCAKMPELS